MKISARNAFPGRITAVKPGAVNAEVVLTTAGGVRIVAVVTNDSIDALGLAVGCEATALVKASSVLVIADGGDVKLSARNCLSGTVSRVREGPVSAEVSIGLPGGGEVHATITRDAVQELGLKKGVEAMAAFKASAVILAVPA